MACVIDFMNYIENTLEYMFNRRAPSIWTVLHSTNCVIWLLIFLNLHLFIYVDLRKIYFAISTSSKLSI